MAVEDHPLFPKWKASLEDVISTKQLIDDAQTPGECRRLVKRTGMHLRDMRRSQMRFSSRRNKVPAD